MIKNVESEYKLAMLSENLGIFPLTLPRFIFKYTIFNNSMPTLKKI